MTASVPTTTLAEIMFVITFYPQVSAALELVQATVATWTTIAGIAAITSGRSRTWRTNFLTRHGRRRVAIRVSHAIIIAHVIAGTAGASRWV